MGLEDGLAKSATRVITHMNDDHADSLLAYATYYAGFKDAKSAKMSGLTVEGFVLDVTLEDGSIKENVLIPYTTPLESAAAVRKIAVAMHFEAYNELGLTYKIRHNFYGRAVVQAWTHMPAKVKYPLVAVLAGAIGVTVTFTVKVVRLLRRLK